MEEIKGIDLSIVSKYRSQIYGLAALWVMASHAVDYGIFTLGSLGKTGEILRTIFAHGNVGVDIFLFLSGISLFFAYKKEPDLEIFLKRRLKRILPSFFLIVGVIGIIQVIATPQMTIYDFLYSISTLSIWISGNRYCPWYISCILAFYFIYPFIHIFLFPEKNKINEAKRFLRLVFLILVSYFICFALFLFNRNYFDMIEIIIFRLPIFLIGSYMGQFVYQKKKVSYKFLSIILLSFFTYLYLRNNITGEGFYYASYVFGGFSMSYIFAYFFKWIDSLKNKFSKGFDKFFSYTGNISLEVYLTHCMYFHFIEWGYYRMPNHLQWLIAMILAYIAAIYALKICDWISTRKFKILS